jgi:hypothetical protein
MSSVWPYARHANSIIYGTVVSSLNHLPPQKKNQHGINKENTLNGNKISQLSKKDLTRVVSLDTNNQA